MSTKLIVISPNEQKDQAPLPSKSNRKEITQAQFDRLWLEAPEQFDPLRDAMERERLKRTLELLQKYTTLDGKKVVDLGSGAGIFAKMVAQQGAFVDAVDISSNALKALRELKPANVTPIQDFVPFTKLPDQSYDIVISTELIGYLPKEDQRLYFSELARLVKNDGFVICSTGLDIETQGALKDFAVLAETEFQILEWTLSYHAFFIHFKSFFKAPATFSEGYEDKKEREKQIAKRSGFAKTWYRLNSSVFLGPFWKFDTLISRSRARWIENNRALLLGLEKICKFIQNDNGVSHGIFIGKLRPLLIPTSEELMAREPKHKKQVWE